MPEFYPDCIYTIREKETLQENEKWRLFSFVEQRQWKSGQEILLKAKAEGKRVVVFFSDAVRVGSLIYAALLHDVDIVDGETKVTVEELRRIGNRKSNELKVKSTGKPISENDIRPYRICDTPEFAKKLRWRDDIQSLSN